MLDFVGLAGGKYELPGGDIDLAAAEIHGINAALHGSDDVLRSVWPGPHVGVGHPRERDVRERLAAAIPRRTRAHEPRIQLILHVPAQNSVFNQRRALGRSSLIVDVQRAAPLRERAIINDRALRRSHALTDATREGRGSLAVEVSFEPVADGFVQQYSRPTGTQHHGHRAGGGRLRLEIHQRLTRGLATERQRQVIGNQLLERKAAARAGVTLLPTSVLLHEHGHVEAHQRAHVGRQLSVARRDENDFVDRRHTGGDLHDSRIEAARFAVDALEPRDFLLIGQRGHRIQGEIQMMPRLRLPGTD